MASLFTPLRIKGLVLKNRIVFPPMATYLATLEGGVTEEQRAHYLARAEAGVGLIILEHAFITPMGRARIGQLGIDSDDKVSGLASLVKSLQQTGTKVVAQLNHAGSNTQPKVLGAQPVSASAIEHPSSRIVPQEMNIQDIDDVVTAFAEAAKRAKIAGCDGLEIHCCHGNLLNQFLSPLTNNRLDMYGGTIQRRSKICLRIIKAVRLAVGDDYPVFCRLVADDGLPGGITLADAKLLAVEMVKAGIDVLDISGGFGGYSPKGVGPAYFLPLAFGIKKTVEVPVICTGGIREPELADSIVREGKADLVGVGRMQLTDPLWATKARDILNCSSN